jgi:hypothetical protein
MNSTYNLPGSLEIRIHSEPKSESVSFLNSYSNGSCKSLYTMLVSKQSKIYLNF